MLNNLERLEAKRKGEDFSQCDAASLHHKLEFYRAWVHAEAPMLAAAVETAWLEKCEREGIHGEEGER